MKFLKKSIALLLAIAMAFTISGFTASDTGAATALKVKNGTSKTIEVGSNASIAINLPKGKVTFSSSNKKVATVTKTGLVKAVASGNATITVKDKASSKKVNVKVKVVPAPVKNVTAQETGDTSVKISWTNQKNVTGYYIYQSTNANSSFKKIATVNGAGKKTVTISNLTGGKLYYYKVAAFRKVSGKFYVGDMSANNKNKLNWAMKKTRQTVKDYLNSAKTYKLVWSDEFNYTDISKLEENWVYEVGNGTDGWGNKEWEWYTAGDNVALEDGKLVIIPKYDEENTEPSVDNPDVLVSAPYTSTRIKTKGKFTFTYGKVEFRCKLPSAKGTWAAAWMLGDADKWPASGEIDVMETMSDTTSGDFKLDYIPQSVHCKKYNGLAGNAANRHWDSIVTGSTTDYHTYGIYWTKDAITFYIDGVETGTYNPELYASTVTSAVWPFDNPCYLLLNVAVGGAMTGQQVDDDAINSLASRMYIDYVRVYQ